MPCTYYSLELPLLPVSVCHQRDGVAAECTCPLRPSWHARVGYSAMFRNSLHCAIPCPLPIEPAN